MLRVVFQGETHEVDLGAFLNALSATLEALHDADRSATPGQRKLTWKLRGLHSSRPTAQIAPEPRSSLKRPPAQGYERLITDRFFEALHAIETGGGAPYLSDATLSHLHQVTGGFDAEGMLGISITTTDRPQAREVRLTRSAYRYLDKLLTPTNAAIGSVTGIVVTITVDKGKRLATVRDDVFSGAVRCQLPGVQLVEAATAALGRRVTVSGHVLSNERGQPQRIEARSIEMLPGDDEFPEAAKTAGALPDFTGGMATDEWLRRGRERG
jgi:hypothetical protein